MYSVLRVTAGNVLEGCEQGKQVHTDGPFHSSHLELQISQGGRTHAQVMGGGGGEGFSDTKLLLRKFKYANLEKCHPTYISYIFEHYQF